MTAALAIKSLHFSYPDGTPALQGINLQIMPGERGAVLGPNGAGKTTLMLHTNGLLRPTAGEISVSGTPLTEQNLPEIRQRVGMVFQDPDDQLFMPTVGGPQRKAFLPQPAPTPFEPPPHLPIAPH